MNIDSFTTFCASLPDVSEEFPFGPDTLVYKVRGKIFAIAGIAEFNSVSLKCDPELAIELREQYTGVTPGYHLNKKHWNTVQLNQGISDKLVREWIQHSYDLVNTKTAGKKKNNTASKKATSTKKPHEITPGKAAAKAGKKVLPEHEQAQTKSKTVIKNSHKKR